MAQLEIEHAGGNALRIRADVRDYEQVNAGVDRMRVHFGDVQVAICAAAVLGPVGPFLDSSPKSWADVVETNLLGVMNVCRVVLPAMIKRRSGKIIVLSDRGAADPRPNLSLFAASKAAVIRLVETLAAEVSDYNVQVNCLGPGGTYTVMTDEILRAGDRAGWKEIEEAREIRLTGGTSPDRQLQLALFLASEQSNHVSGKLIQVTDDWKKLKNSSVHPEIYACAAVPEGVGVYNPAFRAATRVTLDQSDSAWPCATAARN